VDLNVWRRIKGWFRRKPAEVVPFREPVAFDWPPFPDPANANPPDPEPAGYASDRPKLSVSLLQPHLDEVLRALEEPPPAQFTAAVCSCCKCQPSIYRTYGDGTVLCVECAG
jgi:hypothetical protein